jgi:hypothetical protein
MFQSFQIIFRGLVGSLLKSMNLKVFLKIVNLIVVMRQHNVWCVCMVTHTHTNHYAATSPQLTFTIFKKTFKFIDFNKEPTSPLKMI